MKASREGAVFMVGGVMPSKGDGAGTDTSRPHHAYGHRRNTDNRQRLWGNIGFADATSKTNCRSSVFLSLLLVRAFTTAPSLTAWQQSTSRDSDVPPSCVADISQTRLSGTGQCHSFMNAYQRRLSDIVQYRCSIVWRWDWCRHKTMLWSTNILLLSMRECQLQGI